jgi:hypothetical protein
VLVTETSVRLKALSLSMKLIEILIGFYEPFCHAMQRRPGAAIVEGRAHISLQHRQVVEHEMR